MADGAVNIYKGTVDAGATLCNEKCFSNPGSSDAVLSFTVYRRFKKRAEISDKDIIYGRKIRPI